MRYTFTKGDTSKSVYVEAWNSADGTPNASLAFNTAGLTATYTRHGATATSITLATLANAGSAWSSGGFVVVIGNMYRLDIPNAALATGVDRGEIHFALTGVVFSREGFDLITDDPYAAGLTKAEIALEVQQQTFDDSIGGSYGEKITELATAWTTALTESYPADGATVTPAQALYIMLAFLQEKSIVGTTLTINKLDGTTPAATYTLNSATSPTAVTRAT
jgi:hypothetical protein